MPDSDAHVMDTDYRYSSARALVDYIDREEHELKNRAGQTMTDEEREIFQARSEHYEFERHMIISPADDGYSDQELEEATRKSINNWFDDAETVDFCYTVHRDTDSAHTHVALTGDRDDLGMFPEEMNPFREQSEELFQEQQQDLEHELHRENDLEQEQEQEQQQDRGHALD